MLCLILGIAALFVESEGGLGMLAHLPDVPRKGSPITKGPKPSTEDLGSLGLRPGVNYSTLLMPQVGCGLWLWGCGLGFRAQ